MSFLLDTQRMLYIQQWWIIPSSDLARNFNSPTIFSKMINSREIVALSHSMIKPVEWSSLNLSKPILGGDKCTVGFLFAN